MGKNIVERAVSPYNAANRAIQHETYGLFAPAANVNKPGMAGFDPRYFAVREQIVELSQTFLKTIQPIIREVPEQGIDDILELDCIYMNVSARVVDTVSANGELEYIDVTGSLMVFGTETVQTQVLFAEGRIWIRKITQKDSEVTIDTFIPIAEQAGVELLNARVAGLDTTIYDEVHYIPEVFDTVSDQVFGKTGTYRGYYLTFGKDYLCKIPDDEPIPTEFDMLVEVAATISGPEWLAIINDPENSSSANRFCSLRIESFEDSVVTYWLNGRKYEVVYGESGVSSTTAILWCNYEVLTKEYGLPTFAYVYPLKNRIKVLEKRMDAAITAEQVRAIVDEELGVIVNGRY